MGLTVQNMGLDTVCASGRLPPLALVPSNELDISIILSYVMNNSHCLCKIQQTASNRSTLILKYNYMKSSNLNGQ